VVGRNGPLAVADEETRLSDYCCIAMGTTGLSTLFNLTPLLKLDGYYLLVDYLGMPNLRKRAFDHVVLKLTSWLRPAGEKRGEITKRERRVFWLYGLTAGICSIAVLGFVSWKAAEYVFRNFQGTGLLFLGGASSWR